MIFRIGLLLLLLAAPVAANDKALMEADALYAAGGLDHIEASLALYAQARQIMPAHYDTLWKSARAHRDFANRVKQENRSDWKAVCKEQGKMAMNLAEAAIDLAPENVEGHYYFGELLIKLGGKANKAEARCWLEQATRSSETYFADWARRLLQKID